MEKNAKLRPFLVAKIIFERTDEDNYLTIAQILDILKKEYGIESYRKTIQADIDTLIAFGFDIQETKSTQNRYNLVSRQFDNAELKLLIDAVESAKFIPASKSKGLVEKISALGGINQGEKLKRNVSVEGRIKANNDKIFMIIDAINTAINQKKKISFTYFQYNVRKEQKLRHDGEPYVITPLHLVWNGDYYYMVGVYDYRGRLGNFRVDRIASYPEILDEEATPAPEGFDINAYINTSFRMFQCDPCEVELICDNSLMDAIIDRFGEDVTTFANDMTSFRAVVNVAPTHIFYSWVFGFGGLVSIRGPVDVKEKYKEMVQSVAEKLPVTV